ncbi:hypothetical protein [Streptomyces acidicola]|uniref:hypothetical protein n=1 Tax=Streptomyces acidicola TaxID=2596892 RepID=UPI0037F42299
MPLLGGFVRLHRLGGVGTQQVVELEPVRSGLFQQVGAYEIVEQLAGSAGGEFAERGRGGEAELRPGVQPEQPEKAG